MWVGCKIMVKKKGYKKRKKKYRVRGLFPPGDMTFDSRKEAVAFQKRKKREGYAVDKKIYLY